MNQEQEMRTRALELLGQNANSDEVMRKTGLSKMQVAALKAHITMGTYSKRPVTQPTPSPSPRPSLAREDERYDLARRLAEEGRQNAYIRAQTGLGKMQVAGFLAASSRKKRNLESKAGATSLHQTDLLTTPEIQPETDNRQSITKQEAIELMTTKGGSED